MSLGAGATVRFMGSNEVRCEAPLIADKGLNLLVADGVTDVAVRDCDVTAKAAPGGALLTATRSARVVATGNQLVNMAIFTTANSGGPGSQATDVTLTGNASLFPKGGGPFGHVRLTVTGNTLACGALCTAFYSEGEDGLVFAGNTLTNGVVLFANYANSVVIRGNTLRFTAALGTHPTICRADAQRRTPHEIADNWISNETPAGETTCISQGWSDFNSVDEMRIVRNTGLGFAKGIATVTNGGNPGAPHAV